ncbi:MAG: bacteriophage protein [Cyclobacteriaceae bacterium]|nr:MAG: bacteriophage protein [Cyclobacteriaceae bacterium]
MPRFISAITSDKEYLPPKENNMNYSLTWLPTILKNVGLKVAEEPGWEERGTREIGTINGIICHHTAGPKNGNMPSLHVVRDGRSDLPGPLSQLCLGRDGTFYVVAAGRANHAGRGEWQGITNGNSHFIGIEAENTGKDNDFPWPEVQMDAYRRGCAAILLHISQPVIMCCGHKEFALPRGRKIDPLFDMNNFRLKVAAIMDGTTRPPVLIPPSTPDGRPTLRRGAKGNLVEQVQTKVGTTVDGNFGPKTEAAVRVLQRAHGLVADGIVGPKTWAALDDV